MAWPFSEEDSRWNVQVMPRSDEEDEEPQFWLYEGESEEEFRDAWLND